MKSLPLCLMLIIVCSLAYAHGDVHERIKKITEQIKANPDETSLYMERGILYHIDESYDSASWDFEKVVRLIPDFYNAHIYLAEAYFGLNKFDDALKLLNGCADLYRDHFEWYTIRAHILYEQELYAEAAADFLSVLKIREKAVPQDYINYARAEAQRGSEGISRALHAIDASELELGWVITLKEYAIELELRRENYAEALRRTDGILQKMPRKEKWLADKGDILALTGNKEAAMEVYNEALTAIAQLPQRTRSTQSIQKLEKQIIQAIKKLF